MALGDADQLVQVIQNLLKNAAQAAGPGGGRIAVGAPADLVCVGMGSNRLAGADRSLPDDAIVFGAGAPDVTDVVVAGRHVVTNGSHRAVATAEELDRVIQALFR